MNISEKLATAAAELNGRMDEITRECQPLAELLLDITNHPDAVIESQIIRLMGRTEYTAPYASIGAAVSNIRLDEVLALATKRGLIGHPSSVCSSVYIHSGESMLRLDGVMHSHPTQA